MRNLIVGAKSVSVRDMLSSRTILFFASVLFFAFLVASSASASSISLVDSFAPLPVSPYVYEMIWNGSELYEGPGAIGTGFGTGGSGDGELDPTLQFAPGLAVQTPYVITGIPGSIVNTASLPNSTLFMDATLDIIPIGSALYGIPAIGDAQVFGSMIIQPLGSANFEIWSTDSSATPTVEDPVLLLSGTIQSAFITCLLGSSTGSTLSANVVYDGGAILAASGLGNVSGQFSWTLLGATPLFSVGSNKKLAPFEANATGQFDAMPVPEPGTFALLCLGGLGLVGFTWRKRR